MIKGRISRALWAIAIAVGPVLCAFAIATGNREDSPLLWIGCLITLVVCPAFAMLQKPRQGKFAGAFLACWSAGALACTFAVVHLPIISLPLVFLWTFPHLLPLMALGLARARRSQGSRINTIIFGLLAATFAFLGPIFTPFYMAYKYPPAPHHSHDSDLLPTIEPEDTNQGEEWQAVFPHANVQNSLECDKTNALISIELSPLAHHEAILADLRFASYQAALDHLNSNQLPWVPSAQMVDYKIGRFSRQALVAILQHLDKSHDRDPALAFEISAFRSVGRLRSRHESSVPVSSSGTSRIWSEVEQIAQRSLWNPGDSQETPWLSLSEDYKSLRSGNYVRNSIVQRRLYFDHLLDDHDCADFVNPIDIPPDIAVEPVAAFYLRSAQSLRTLESIARDQLGDDTWAAIALGNGQFLSDVLPEYVALLHGLYLTVCQNTGLPPDLPELEATEAALALERAQSWLASASQDTAWADDVREIAADQSVDNAEHARYHMSTGVHLLKVTATYLRPPRLRKNGVLLEGDDRPENHLIFFGPREFFLPVEEFSEVTGPRVSYSREEFRELCDTTGSREGILRAIASGERANHSKPFVSTRWIVIFVSIVALPLGLIYTAIRRRRQYGGRSGG